MICIFSHWFLHTMISITGADPGFQVRGGRTSNICAERKEARKFLGYFVWKITILRQKILFFPILGGRVPGAPPPPPLDPLLYYQLISVIWKLSLISMHHYVMLYWHQYHWHGLDKSLINICFAWNGVLIVSCIPGLGFNEILNQFSQNKSAIVYMY
jgi:hypothetical protein